MALLLEPGVAVEVGWYTALVSPPGFLADVLLAPEVDRRIGAATAAGLRDPRPTVRPAPARWWQLALLAPGGVAAVSLGLWLGAALPAAAPGIPTTAVQMAPFSNVPAGALCPVPQACRGSLR